MLLKVRGYPNPYNLWEQHSLNLGQFLVTRPDIIGDELAKQLEGLQDRLPAFSLSEAKTMLLKKI